MAKQIQKEKTRLESLCAQHSAAPKIQRKLGPLMRWSDIRLKQRCYKLSCVTCSFQFSTYFSKKRCCKQCLKAFFRVRKLRFTWNKLNPYLEVSSSEISWGLTELVRHIETQGTTSATHISTQHLSLVQNILVGITFQSTSDHQHDFTFVFGPTVAIKIPNTFTFTLFHHHYKSSL